MLVCHGLADSRRCVHTLADPARAAGLRLIGPDRPGIGWTGWRELSQVSDWVVDGVAVLDALEVERAAVVGISGGGPFAAACAAALPGRITALVLIGALGSVEWGISGMAAGERFSLALAARVPGFGGWFLGRLADLARYSPRLFLELATVELPRVDREALGNPVQREAFLEGYLEAFRHGDAGVRQDLRVLTRAWGFRLEGIEVPTWVHHGDADTTVPQAHAERYAQAIPGARLRVHAGQGHFSLLSGAGDELLRGLTSAGG